MRLFHGFLLFFLLSLPFVFWLVRANTRKIPSFTIFSNNFARLIAVYLLLAMLLYVYVPTYREHIEPLVTNITLMFLDGRPVYTDFSDKEIYSVLYGPTTYLLQAVFLKLFSNPILGSKVYGVACLTIGMLVLFSLIYRKYGSRTLHLSMVYFFIPVLMFEQVSFRNQSDSVILLGNSLAVASIFLPSSITSMVLLALGAALSFDAKFHSLGYILPLVLFIYRQHGFKRLLMVFILFAAFVVSPFLFDSISLQNFISMMHGYSKLPVHGWLFGHNLSMGFVIFLPLLFLLFVNARASSSVASRNDALITLIITSVVLVLICFVAGIDGAGSYHLAPFAPTLAALYAIFYSQNSTVEKEFIAKQRLSIKRAYVALFIGWLLTTSVFILSTQKKYLLFIDENKSYAIHSEVVVIHKILAQSHVNAAIGYTDREGYDFMFYRPLLWDVTKNFMLDPVPMMGREAVGIPIPATAYDKFLNKEIDVVVMPKEGKPFSMENWHKPGMHVYNQEFRDRFLENYELFKSFHYFSLWRAKGRQIPALSGLADP